jgi:hypothetical protein
VVTVNVAWGVPYVPLRVSTAVFVRFRPASRAALASAFLGSPRVTPITTITAPTRQTARTMMSAARRFFGDEGPPSYGRDVPGPLTSSAAPRLTGPTFMIPP